MRKCRIPPSWTRSHEGFRVSKAHEEETPYQAYSQNEKKNKKLVHARSLSCKAGDCFLTQGFQACFKKKKKLAHPGRLLLQIDDWISPKFLHNVWLFEHVEAIIPRACALWVQFRSLTVSQLENDWRTHISRIARKQDLPEQVRIPSLTTVWPPRRSETKVGGPP